MIRISQSLFACSSWRALDPNSNNEDLGGNVSLATFLMLSMIYSLLPLSNLVLFAANILFNRETAKEFEKITLFYVKRRAIIGVFSQ